MTAKTHLPNRLKSAALGVVLSAVLVTLMVGWIALVGTAQAGAALEVERASEEAPTSAAIDAVKAWRPSPSAVVRQHDKLVGTRMPGCEPATKFFWIDGSQRVTTVIVLSCVTVQDARFYSQGRQSELAEISGDEPVVVKGEEFDLFTFHREGSVGRLWVQGTTEYVLETMCSADRAGCEVGNAGHVAALATLVPGDMEGSDLSIELASELLFGFLILWLLLAVTPNRLAAALRRERLRTPWDENYVDVSAPVRRFRRLNNARPFAILAVLLGAIGALGLLVTLTEQSGDFPRLVAAGYLTLGLIGGWLLVRRRRSLREVLRANTTPAGESTRAMMGRGLQNAARLSLGAAVVLSMSLLLLAGVTDNVSPAFARDQMSTLLESPVTPANTLRLLVTAGVVAMSYEPTFVFVFGVLPVLVFSGLLLAAGRRLAVASIREALLEDSNYFLLLRAFEEDKAKVRAYLRHGRLLPTWLDPRVSARFEEVLASVLGRFGSVVALAPPGTRLPSLGAAKESLNHGEWQERVRELAVGARGVVILTTPKAVNAGLFWEMELIAESADLGRVLLVLSPRRWRVTQARWQVFVEACAALPGLHGLRDHRLIPGTHVVFWYRDRWIGVGADEKSDVSYGHAMQKALSLVT